MAERETDVGDRRQIGAFARQSLRNHDSEEPLSANLGECLGREAPLRVDGRGVARRDIGSRARARRQILEAGI